MIFLFFTGKSRLYPTYSISSSEAEESPIHRSQYNHPYNTPSHQYPIKYKPTGGLSDTPSSDNASDATLTDTEQARDNIHLVTNGKFFVYKTHILPGKKKQKIGKILKN